jgi:hypothetical protein
VEGDEPPRERKQREAKQHVQHMKVAARGDQSTQQQLSCARLVQPRRKRVQSLRNARIQIPSVTSHQLSLRWGHGCWQGVAHASQIRPHTSTVVRRNRAARPGRTHSHKFSHRADAVGEQLGSTTLPVGGHELRSARAAQGGRSHTLHSHSPRLERM